MTAKTLDSRLDEAQHDDPRSVVERLPLLGIEVARRLDRNGSTRRSIRNGPSGRTPPKIVARQGGDSRAVREDRLGA